MNNKKIEITSLLRIMLIFIAISFLGTNVVYSVPANGVLAEFKQPDGTKFSARLLGDEWYSWHETAKGYTIMLDEKDGWWKFAIRDAQGFLKPGIFRVGVDNPAQLGLMKKVEASKDVIGSLRQLQHLGLGIPAITESNITEIEPSPGQPPPKEVSPKGNVKNLVILCNFSDHDTTKYFPAIMYDSVFNTVGYSYDGAVGSVKDYYVENSYGQLTILSTIAGDSWFTLPHTEAYYGTDASPTSKDTAIKQMIIDALAAADSSVDFSLFDNDGDGYVDSITFIHSGYGQEYSGNPSTCIWSKKWSLDSPYVTAEGIRVSNFHTEPALRGLYTSGRNMGRIGVICHETGHFFGLPDLYDTVGSSEGIGAWGIMGSGSWGADGGSYPERPTHFDAWCKTQLGWLTSSIMHSKSGQSLVRVETNKSIGKVSEGLPVSEYYLLENRQTYGFDSQLRGNGGLCIWHIDEAKKNNNTPYNYMVALEEADGNLSLQLGTSRAQTGDPYPGSSSNTTFSPYSNPSTYSNPIGGGSNSYISALNISTSSSGASFNLQTLVPTINNPSDNTTGTYTVSWSTSVNATKYMLAEGIATTVPSFSDGAENDTTFREEWSKLGDFKRTNQNASAGSYSYLARWCDDPNGTGLWTQWNSDYQFLTLNQPFLVTSTTQVIFKTRYYLQTNAVPWQRAYLQVRRATEETWSNVSVFKGDVTTSWASVTIGSSLMSGFSGTTCYLRFTAINHAGPVYSYYTTTSNWPWNGFAFDEFAINNAQFATFNWSTVDNNIPSTSTSTTFTGKAVGTYAYKVAGYANSAWQNWSNIEDAVVSLPPILPGGNPVDYAASNLPVATAYNGGRRTVRDNEGYYHVVYSSSLDTISGSIPSEIWYTYSRTPSITASWSTPVNISITPAQSYCPSIAIDKATNRLYVVWQDNTYGDYDIWFTTSANTTKPPIWSSSTCIYNPITDSDDLFPVIDVASTGVIHVAWQKMYWPNPPGTNSEIVYMRSLDKGTTWVSNTPFAGDTVPPGFPDNVSQTPTTNSQMPSLANQMYYSGTDFHVVWNEDSVLAPGMPGMPKPHIWYRHNQGGPGYGWDPIEDISSQSDMFFYGLDGYPCVAVDTNNRPHVVWMTGVTPGVPYPAVTGQQLIFYSRRTAVGNYGGVSTWRSPMEGVSTTGGYETADNQYPSIAIETSQQLDCVWQVTTTGFDISDWEIVYNNNPPAWVGWQTPVDHSTDLARDDYFPNLAYKITGLVTNGQSYGNGYAYVWTKAAVGDAGPYTIWFNGTNNIVVPVELSRFIAIPGDIENQSFDWSRYPELQ